MKRLLVGLALFAAACSGQSPSAPSGTSTSSIGVQAPAAPGSGAGASVPTVDPTPGGPGNTATVPQFTFTGPRNPQNCFTAGTDPMQWVLNVTDAGPRALRLIALAHQDDTPGCEATAKNPRARVAMSGVTDYTPHSVGQTSFTFDPKMYNCGRVQVDVSIFDSNGNEILILGTVINYGTQCAPPPPNSLVCAPATQSPFINTPVAFTATGGNGTYSWSSPSGTPVSGAGASYTTQYTNPGGYVVTVTSNGQSATCQVQAQPNVVPPPVCLPATQTVLNGVPATVTASGGNGVFSWAATGGTVASGSGSSFTTSYNSAGTHNIVLTSNGVNVTCQVITTNEPPPLVCAPPSQTALTGQTVNMSATGGNGIYSWSAPGGSTTTGSGAAFNTSYGAAGSYTATVTSGSQTQQCTVTVTQTPPPPLVCAPPTQTAQIGQTVNMSATGGNGTYSWSAPGGSTTTGSGAAFNTSYGAAGSYTATVTSGSQTQQCTVTVTQTPPPLVCAPPSQTAAIGQTVNMSATGGTGTYTWLAPGGSTTAGSGAAFNTSYGAAGSYTATVTSGSQSQQCTVTVPPTPPPTLACTPPSQTGTLNGPVNFQTTGTASGPFTWTAVGGVNASGTGTTFQTSYATPGTYSVTVTNGTVTSAPCTVTIPPPPLVCTPASQTAQIGQTTVFGATGGTGTYTWSAPGSSAPTGTGGSFSTTYPAAGSYVATVTSGSLTAQCLVTVPPPLLNSCLGTTGTVTDIIPPVGAVQVVVPSGQLSNILINVTDHTLGTVTGYNFPGIGAGTTSLQVPLPCFPKIELYCGNTLLAFQSGQDTCP